MINCGRTERLTSVTNQGMAAIDGAIALHLIGEGEYTDRASDYIGVLIEVLHGQIAYFIRDFALEEYCLGRHLANIQGIQTAIDLLVPMLVRLVDELKHPFDLTRERLKQLEELFLEANRRIIQEANDLMNARSR
jgi:hypothetical protein